MLYVQDFLLFAFLKNTIVFFFLRWTGFGIEGRWEETHLMVSLTAVKCGYYFDVAVRNANLERLRGVRKSMLPFSSSIVERVRPCSFSALPVTRGKKGL